MKRRKLSKVNEYDYIIYGVMKNYLFKCCGFDHTPEDCNFVAEKIKWSIENGADIRRIRDAIDNLHQDVLYAIAQAIANDIAVDEIPSPNDPRMDEPAQALLSKVAEVKKIENERLSALNVITSAMLKAGKRTPEYNAKMDDLTHELSMLLTSIGKILDEYYS